MASSNVCWGIELGAGAIKGLKLIRDGDRLTVADFLIVPHKRPLASPDVNEQDAMRVAIGEFASQRDFSKTPIAVSVPGHASFARFAKLPPTEPKKIPDIVKFEAAQQIPFPIDEVEWDYQIFANEDEPDVEVGIFAVTRERVMERLDLCADVDLRPDALSLSPVSLFNAIAYDRSLDADSAGLVIVDIGSVATDLIVIDGGRVWIRTFPMGGHAFTEAIESSFKLNYFKAEKLKREADKSKYKRQIFQAMRPAYADFGQEVQRSLQYYRQLHPESDLKHVVGVGSTFRLPGLRKFLGQQLQMEVARLEQFNQLSLDGAKASELQSAALTLGTAYGLALQGVGLATIDANLIPVSVARESLWKRKTPWFATAAAIGVAAGAVSFVRPMLDAAAVEAARQSEAAQRIQQAKSVGGRLQNEWRQIEGSTSIGAMVTNIERLGERRDILGHLVSDIGSMLAAAEPQQELFSGEGRNRIDPSEWRLYRLEGLRVEYQTPSGVAPRGTGELPTPGEGGQPQQAQQQQRGGGGGGGIGATMLSPGGGGGGAGAAPPPRRSRDEQPAQDDGPGSQYGKLQVTLVVDSANAGLKAFVNSTILEWLRTNAERAGAPYTFSVPDADALPQPTVVQQGEASERRSQTSGAGEQTSGGDPSRLGGGGSARLGGGGGGSSANATGVGGNLDSMAPLGDISADFPSDATVHRYTITFEATLKAPDAASEAGEQTASGEEFGS